MKHFIAADSHFPPTHFFRRTSGFFLYKWFFVYCLCLVLPQFSYAQEDDVYLQQGIQFYQYDQYPQAREALTKHLTLYPKSVQGYFYRAYSAVYQGDLKAAEKDFRKAHRLSPKDASVLIGLGYLFNELKNYKKAIRYFDKAIRIDPAIADAYNNRGISLQALGNFRGAIKNYSEAILLDSNLAMAYNNRGSATYYNQSVEAPHVLDIELAVKDFTRALELAPNLCVAWRNRGLTYTFLKKYDEAIADLDRAIACEPDNPVNYLNRGIARHGKGMYNEAISDHMAALQLYPNLAEAYLEMGKSKTRLGYYTEASEDFIQAVKTDKNARATASYELARTMVLAGDETAAMSFITEAEKNNYFRIKQHWDELLKDADFEKLRKTEPFRELQRNIVSKGSSYFKALVAY